MKHLSKIVLCSIFLLYSCLNSSKEEVAHSTDFQKKNHPIVRVPISIKNQLLKKHPTLKIISKEDYSNLFWNFYDASTIPNECFTDINNDQLLDYALLVQDNESLKVAIATSSTKGYSCWLSGSIGEIKTASGVEFALFVKPAGRTDIVKKTPQSLLLNKNGFVLKNLEIEHLILFENQGKIETFLLN